jgi:hypothetical protein
MAETIDRLLFNLQFLEWRHLAEGKDPAQRLSRSLSRTSKSDHQKLTPRFFASLGHSLAPSEEHDLEIFRNGFAGLFDRADDFGYKPIVHAFQRAKLDIKDPLHWQWLMLLMCWAHFPPKRGGRKRVWTTDKYIKLLQDVDRIKIEYRIKSDYKVLQKLQRIGSYRSSSKRSDNVKLGFGGLKKALAEARSVKHNFELKGLVYNEALQRSERLSDLEPDAQEREMAKFIKARTKDHLEEIASRWRAKDGTISEVLDAPRVASNPA